MATADVKDPFNNFNFLVEIDGLSRGAFQQCSGFDSTIDVTEYREGGSNTTPRKIPGLTKHSNITLKWGVTDDMELYKWHKDAVNGDLVRKNGSIVLLNRKGEEVARWNFERAFPVKYHGPDLDAQKSELAIETLELAHEGLTRV
jgi:phage tail-like protein